MIQQDYVSLESRLVWMISIKYNFCLEIGRKSSLISNLEVNPSESVLEIDQYLIIMKLHYYDGYFHGFPEIFKDSFEVIAERIIESSSKCHACYYPVMC